MLIQRLPLHHRPAGQAVGVEFFLGHGQTSHF
jgi:hypothetical protein